MKWNNAKEIIPENGYYLAVTDIGDIAHLECLNGRWNVSKTSTASEIKVRFWMPIPEAPDGYEFRGIDRCIPYKKIAVKEG